MQTFTKKRIQSEFDNEVLEEFRQLNQHAISSILAKHSARSPDPTSSSEKFLEFMNCVDSAYEEYATRVEEWSTKLHNASFPVKVYSANAICIRLMDKFESYREKFVEDRTGNPYSVYVRNKSAEISERVDLFQGELNALMGKNR